jgi:hypothetical protein
MRSINCRTPIGLSKVKVLTGQQPFPQDLIISPADSDEQCTPSKGVIIGMWDQQRHVHHVATLLTYHLFNASFECFPLLWGETPDPRDRFTRTVVYVVGSIGRF